MQDGRKAAGEYTIQFDASNLPSGVYLCRMRAGDISGSSGQPFQQVRKLVLLK